MIKIKIRKVLPYWLGILAITTGAQITAWAMSQPRTSPTAAASEQQAKPEVLGAATDLRGQATVGIITKPQKIGEMDPGNVTARSFLVYDEASGEVLAEKNSQDKYSIASLTKLLTALVVYKNFDLNGYLTISPQDLFKVNPVLGLREDDRILGWDLFNAMLIGSENDAALALSNHTAEAKSKNFVEMMNEEAKALDMKDSRFSNPLGFDSKYNYSTGQDLKKLVNKTQQLSAFTNLGKKTSYSFITQEKHAYRVIATNKLVAKYPEIEAIKTGYTESSQGAMIAKISKDGHKIIVIVLSSQDREGDTLELSKQAFGAYKWQ